MRISRLRLRNWKNFTEVDVKLRDRVFILGPNASGKSNLLDVFRFLKRIALNGFREAVEERDGISKIRCLAARRYSDIEIDVELSINEAQKDTPDWRYSICFNNQPQSGKPALKKEEVWHEGKQIIKRPDESDKEDQDRLYQTSLEQIYANKDFRQIADFFKSIRYMHLVPQIIRNPDTYTPTPSVKGDPYGSDFLGRLAETNKQTLTSRLNRIQEVLKIAVPQLDSLKLEWDKRGVPHLIGAYRHWRAHPSGQNEIQFSDGTLRLIGLLWALFEGDGPLLLEEPELSLHEGFVGKLVPLMYRIQQKRKIRRQIIVSSHSYKLLSDEGIDGSEVLILYSSQEGTAIHTASEKKEIKDMLEAGIPIAEAVIPHTKPEDLEKLDLFK